MATKMPPRQMANYTDLPTIYVIVKWKSLFAKTRTPITQRNAAELRGANNKLKGPNSQLANRVYTRSDSISTFHFISRIHTHTKESQMPKGIYLHFVLFL